MAKSTFIANTSYSAIAKVFQEYSANVTKHESILCKGHKITNNYTCERAELELGDGLIDEEAQTRLRPLSFAK